MHFFIQKLDVGVLLVLLQMFEGTITTFENNFKRNFQFSVSIFIAKYWFVK